MGLMGAELPGTFAEGGLDVGPFENVGGTSGVVGPEGEFLPLQTGVPELLVPGGAGARAAKALVTTREGRFLFGRSGVLNRGRVRIGVGRKGGNLVFRTKIGGGKQARFKLDIVEIGKLP